MVTFNLKLFSLNYKFDLICFSPIITLKLYFTKAEKLEHKPKQCVYSNFIFRAAMWLQRFM